MEGDANSDVERLVDVYKDALNRDEQRIKDYLDSQRYFWKTITGVASFLIVGLGAAAAYLVGSNISDLKTEVIELAETRVQAAIIAGANNVNEINELSSKLSEASTDYEKHKAAIDALSGLNRLERLGIKDPFGTYLKLSEMDSKIQDGTSLSDEERAIALQLLESAIEAGEQGLTEPNTLFNTAVVAGRLNFNSEAVKLTALAEYWQPSISHRVLSAEYASLFGVKFIFDGQAVSQIIKPAAEVRLAAWLDLKNIVSSAPRQEAEQAYSRASNVAVNNRSEGFYLQLAEAIEESKRAGKDLTSYAYVTLSNMYSWQGDVGWESKYWNAIEDGLATLATESPRSSWYQHTVAELVEQALLLDSLEELISRSAKHGFDDGYWEDNVNAVMLRMMRR